MRSAGTPRSSRHNLHALRRAHPRGSCAGGHPLRAQPAVQRQLDAAVRDRPGCGHSHQPPGAVRAARARTTARRRPSRRRRTGCPTQLLSVRAGLLDAGAARRRQPARCSSARCTCAADLQRDDRRGRAAGERRRTPSRGVARAFILAGLLALRGRACWARYLIGTRVSRPAAAHGGGRGARGCRRPASAHPRRRRPGRRGAGCWPTRSTTCSTASPTRSPASARSWPTPRTSCAPR